MAVAVIRSIGCSAKSSSLIWQHVAAELDKAAAGADPADVSVALQIVLMLENVECRAK